MGEIGAAPRNVGKKVFTKNIVINNVFVFLCGELAPEICLLILGTPYKIQVCTHIYISYLSSMLPHLFTTRIVGCYKVKC